MWVSYVYFIFHQCSRNKKWIKVSQITSDQDQLLVNVHLHTASLRRSELDFHAVRFGSQSDPIDWSEVWFSCVLGPDELELPQQSHHDEEELHASQTFPETHPRTWDVEKNTSVSSTTEDLIIYVGMWIVSSCTCRERHEGLWFNKLSFVIEEVFRVEFMREFPLSLLAEHWGQILDDHCSLRTKSTSKPLRMLVTLLPLPI